MKSSISTAFGLAVASLCTSLLAGCTTNGRPPANPGKYRAEAERMKALLVDWLERIESPSLKEVAARRFD